MRIGTAERGSTFWFQGLALKKTLAARGVTEPIEVLESLSASIENARRLDTNDLDFGFMAANWIGRARRGEPPFDRPIALRMVAPMNAGPMFFIAPARLSIFMIDDLRGKKISVGPENSGIRQHAHSILGALGIGFSDFEPIFLDFASGARALLAGEIDAQLQCPIPNKVMSDLDAAIGLRVLPFSDAELETVMKASPTYRRARMRKGSLHALASDLFQPAVVNVLVAHERASSTSVAAVAKAIAEGKDDLPRSEPLFTGLSELLAPLRAEGAEALTFDGVKLHDGAVQGFRQSGYLG